jgi:exosortase K
MLVSESRHMFEWCHRQRLPILWWSLVLAAATALKWYFSVAAVTQLGWMLEPITLLLRVITGWHFKANAAGEWQSVDAGIVLVKACAGINFMIMSLLAWCWLMRPRESSFKPSLVLVDWPLIMATALTLAWLAALLANTLRILLVVHAQPRLEQWLQPDSAHRAIGLLVYLPALSAQVVLLERRRIDHALLIVCAIYAGMMVVLPIVTGNAISNLALYGPHAVVVMMVLAPLLLTAVVLRRRQQRFQQ